MWLQYWGRRRDIHFSTFQERVTIQCGQVIILASFVPFSSAKKKACKICNQFIVLLLAP